MADFPFAADAGEKPSAIEAICDAELARQWRKLIMIPSESICHPAAASILSGCMGNIYAEGLPSPILCHDPRESAGDAARFDTWQTRLADHRFYKGTVNANRVELAAGRFAAEVFAALEGSPDERQIHVNMQPLSGAAANLAVYTALVEPGGDVLGLDLSHGGHLTHGSEFNFSGRTYRAHGYGIDPKTRRLDYDRIRQQALEIRPRLIIGGASSYPWDFDWERLGRIARESGAHLLADISHLAGMVAAGLLANPLPHADVVMFTTHKTLCGPRGAVLMTVNPDIARKLDSAVFPGLQGGPHMNSIAGIGRLFELILSDVEGFKEFQRNTLRNTSFFADALKSLGFTLEYGGTDTHMLLVDLKAFEVEGPVPIDGECAARLLELAGIVCNKNVLPGDPDGAHASGIRLGLTWLTQRGITQAQLHEIASVMKEALERCRTLTIWSPTGDERCRARLPGGVLSRAAGRTLEIARALEFPAPVAEGGAAAAGAAGEHEAFVLRGDKVRQALSHMLSARLPHDGTPAFASMFDGEGGKVDDVVAMQLAGRGREERWLLLTSAGRGPLVKEWIESLSDGYVIIEEDDLQQKVDGPTVVEPVQSGELAGEIGRASRAAEGMPEVDLTKPYFIGQRALYRLSPPAPLEEYSRTETDAPLRKTHLYASHQELGARMAPFAGWQMPIEYGDGILAEHRAVRTAAGLFDVSHMSAFEVSGPDALAFLDSTLANCVTRLDVGQAQYTAIMDPHGVLIDDLYLYRLERERFMIVSNAANAPKVSAWLEAVNSGDVLVDLEMPGKRLAGPVSIRDLRDAGDESLLGLALQGPLSLRLLQTLCDENGDREVLGRLAMNAFARVTLDGQPALAARTGYTGEKIGFELYVHPGSIVSLWKALLDKGRPLGVRAAGLGARDSTRIEAGLPLFGHELEGEGGISITEAGYGFVARFHVPFFIGRNHYMRRVAESKRRIVRLLGQGRKTVRPGHVVLGGGGEVVGVVTSFSYIHEDMTFMALAFVEDGFAPEPGEPVRCARRTREQVKASLDERYVVELEALSRFPDDEEREGWAARYAP